MERDLLNRALAHTLVPARVAEALAAEWPELCNCPALSDAAWESLWNHPSRDAAMTTALVSRELTADQLDRVVASERRAGPLRVALEHNVLGPEQWEVLARRIPRGTLAADIAVDRTCPEHLRARFVAAGNATTRIWPVAGSPGSSPSDRIEALGALDPLPPSGWRAYHDAWRAVVAVHPETVPLIAAGGSPRAAALAAAGALALLGEDLQLTLLDAYRSGPDLGYLTAALAANPAATRGTLEVLAAAGEYLAVSRLREEKPMLDRPVLEVDDRAVLARLVDRAAPVGHDHRRDRPWFAVVLSGSEQLDDTQRERLADTLTAYAADWEAPAPGDLAPAFAAAATRLGLDGIDLAPRGAWVGATQSICDDVPSADPTRLRAALLTGYSWDATVAATALAPLLGDDPDVWRAAMALAPDYPGSLAELAAVAAAVAA